MLSVPLCERGIFSFSPPHSQFWGTMRFPEENCSVERDHASDLVVSTFSSSSLFNSYCQFHLVHNGACLFMPYGFPCCSDSGALFYRPQRTQRGLLRLGQAPDPRDIQSLVRSV